MSIKKSKKRKFGKNKYYVNITFVLHFDKKYCF